ncbi:hypothetical protein ABIF73_009317 [Bradyrhizobium japonicum]
MQHALEISVSLIRLAPGATGARAEVFKHKIDVAIEAIGRTIEDEERIRYSDTTMTEGRPRLQGGKGRPGPLRQQVSKK